MVAMASTCASLQAERIKDIADIKGIRSNQLWGYGLVVGLAGTGDNSAASRRALANILRQTGIVVNPDDVSSKNIASVMVTADLPAFGALGSSIDVTVSAIGSSSTLQGGTLLLTKLVGYDGQVYAISQGAVSIGGFLASGDAASVSSNHPTVGRIPNGATIEKEECADFVENGKITWLLRNPDFATAQSVADTINAAYPKAAQATDAGTIIVNVPDKLPKKELVSFVQAVEALEAKVDSPAVVVINERTGTVVVGENVTISTVAIAHGSLSIITQEKEKVSQPGPLSGGTTEKEHNTDIKVIEGKGKLSVIPKQVSVSDLAKALNAMGLTPRDLIAIFMALKKQGALQAQLQIM
jgi:flagellar P-ring protein precursor FlgI